MSTPAAPTPPPKSPPPAGTRATPAPLAPAHGSESLDLEEDIAPNLGGEDQMQDA
jgi:hypothetical protein